VIPVATGFAVSELVGEDVSIMATTAPYAHGVTAAFDSASPGGPKYDLAPMIYLIRHASAGTRGSDPTRNDLDRPLDAYGWDRANAIADELTDAGITHVASSRAVRCVQTVQPLAHVLGTTVVEDPSLLEGQSADAAVHEFRRLVQQGTSAALCSHGDIIPDAIQLLAREGVVLVGPRGWAKGSIWALETRGTDIVSATFRGPF